jgi:DinB superfamily
MPASPHAETSRIADQLRRALEGEAWHGPALLEVLDGVGAAGAAARPLPDAHRIWEVVLHVAVWNDVARRRMAGEVVQPPPHEDWPAVTDVSPAAWLRTLAHLKQTHAALVEAVTACPDARLSEQVPGKEPDFYTLYYMLHGIVQHVLYHAGQIVILKKALP